MFGSGSIETMGLNAKLTKKLLKGVSVSTKMIKSENDNYKKLKIKIKDLKLKRKSAKLKKNTQKKLKIEEQLSRLILQLRHSKVVKPRALPWTTSSISNSE